MLNKVLAVIFIVLFSLVLGWSVVFCLDAIDSKNWVFVLMSIAVAIISIIRIVYYAKGLFLGDKEE
jgi:hypothetical protein